MSTYLNILGFIFIKGTSMNFITFLEETDQSISWLDRYTQFFLEDNKKIIYQGFSLTEMYIKFALFKLLAGKGHRVTYVCNSIEQSFYFFKKLLNDLDISTSLYDVDSTKIKFFNDSVIEFLPLHLATNHSITSETLLIDVDFFPTKTSEYIIFQAMNSPHKPFNILCSISEIESTTFFNEYFDLLQAKLPVIKNFSE